METLLRFFFSKSIILKFFGGVLMLVGFVLTPFIIGIPILLLGWFMALFGYLIQFTNLIPEDKRQKIGALVKESYRPYSGAAQSFIIVGKDMVRISFMVFLFLVIGAGAITKKLGWW